MIAYTKNHACGHFNRQQVEDTLNVHAIKDFGAINDRPAGILSK